MIKKSYFPTPTVDPYTFLHIFETPNGEYRISAGQSRDFVAMETRIVPKNNPETLLKLIHELSGISYTPVVKEPPTTIPKELSTEPDLVPVEEVVAPMSPWEEQLSKMPASEIIAKVLLETGVQITLSPKSKKAIIKKALALYNK